MTHEVFDSEQMSAMKLAIELVIEDLGGENPDRSKIAHAVFGVASETSEFDPAELAELARKRLAQEDSRL